jgi:hypothetical protein
MADALVGGKIAVSDGEQVAEAAIEAVKSRDEGNSVLVIATFGEDQANFEWTESAILLADGTRVDETTQDRGRKAQGAIWTFEAALAPEPEAA